MCFGLDGVVWFVYPQTKLRLYPHEHQFAGDVGEDFIQLGVSSHLLLDPDRSRGTPQPRL